MKDLVNSPAKKYQDIFDTISNTNTNLNSNRNRNKYLPSDNMDTDYTDINLLPTENTNFASLTSSSNDMKDELKSFLKKQLNSSDQELGKGFGREFGSDF
jgi:hypothetical protein